MAQKSSDKSKITADMPQINEGRMYHIGLAKGEAAPFILMCGDPARVEKTASFLDEKSKPICHREYVTVTGKYKGIPVSVMATGMGPDNTEIAIVELSQIVSKPTLIRIGTSGALQPDIKIGDMVVSSGALRLENTSTCFVHEGYPAVACHEVILSLMTAAGKLNLKYHLGITATASGFYGAQGRKTPFFTPKNTDILNELERMKILNMEMESSALFTMSSLAGFRSGTVCVVIAERTANKFIDKDTLARVEVDCIKIGLGAVEILAKMDKARGKAAYWLPTMGV
ncbi:MAG: nucleoside phosphorylase [Deltaproteobacteria bacterium]|nr:nucleoside phosphorylase [Deltaproteobacteria bacterium]